MTTDSFSSPIARLSPPEALLGPGRHATKLARSPYAGRLTAYLREAIIGGELPEGTPLVEAKLADMLSVSRGPIRNALTVLEGEGLVHTRSNGRVVSKGFDESDVEDLLRVRFELEATAIRWGRAQRASVDTIAVAMAAIRDGGAASERLVQADLDFHRALFDYSCSRFLTQAWLAIAPVIQAVITIGNGRLVAQDPQSHFARILRSHQAILDALQSENDELAIDLLRDQFGLTRSMFTGPEGAGA